VAAPRRTRPIRSEIRQRITARLRRRVAQDALLAALMHAPSPEEAKFSESPEEDQLMPGQPVALRTVLSPAALHNLLAEAHATAH
jgi:hypothetical protein